MAEVGRQEAQCGVLMGLQIVQILGLEGDSGLGSLGPRAPGQTHGSLDTLDSITVPCGYPVCRRSGCEWVSHGLGVVSGVAVDPQIYLGSPSR